MFLDRQNSYLVSTWFIGHKFIIMTRTCTDKARGLTSSVVRAYARARLVCMCVCLCVEQRERQRKRERDVYFLYEDDFNTISHLEFEASLSITDIIHTCAITAFVLLCGLQ